MPSPTFVAEHESAWNNSIPISESTTTAPGEVLAAFGGIHNGSAQLNLPSGGGLTWTQRQYRKPSNSYCTAYLWSSAASSAASFDTSLTKVVTDSALLGINILRFTGSGGIGASANNSASSGAPTLTLTTTQDNSAIVMLVLDWRGTSGARTYRSGAGAFTELSYYQAGQWTVQGGYYPDAGPAGQKTVGISSPSGQKYTIVAMEILGATATEPNSGSASGAYTFTGATSGSRDSHGATSGGYGWAAVASGAIQHRGATSTVYAWSGDVAGSTHHRGTVVGGHDWAGSASGTTRHQGVAVVAYGFTGTTSGTAPGVEDHSGTASGSYAFAATTTGSTAHRGAADGFYFWFGWADGGEITLFMDRDLTILATTEPVSGWETNGPTTAWTATEPTAQTITGTEPTSGWTFTEPEH